jgi:hypothetical protein
MEPKTAAELQAMVTADAAKYAKVIEDTGMKVQE